jgi:uroporphyrinogen-III synthase
MKNTAKHLLFLNDLSTQTLEELNSDNSIKVSSEPLIKTSAITFNHDDLDVTKTWVFTSRKAIEILLEHNLSFSKKIYAIGQKTADLIPSAIIPEKASAIDLAKLIIKAQEKDVIFICGNRRRNDLPSKLLSHGIKVKEVTVYQTENLNKTVNLQGIDGLAFMSPSAVYSLAQNGGFKNLPCFAIGTTTALALKDEGQKCMISKTTNAKSLVDIAKHYLNK